MVNPFFFQMIWEIVRFKEDVLSYLEKLEAGDESIRKDETLGEFVVSHKYSNKFRDCYLVPVCGSIWSCSTDVVLGFSAASILTFCKNHHLLQLFGRPQWLTVKGRSETYVAKMIADLQAVGSTIRTSCGVTRISSSAEGVVVEDVHGRVEVFDRCVVGSHAPDALQILGDGATYEERTILGAFQYSPSFDIMRDDLGVLGRDFPLCSAWPARRLINQETTQLLLCE